MSSHHSNATSHRSNPESHEIDNRRRSTFSEVFRGRISQAFTRHSWVMDRMSTLSKDRRHYPIMGLDLTSNFLMIVVGLDYISAGTRNSYQTLFLGIYVTLAALIAVITVLFESRIVNDNCPFCNKTLGRAFYSIVIGSLFMTTVGFNKIAGIVSVATGIILILIRRFRRIYMLTPLIPLQETLSSQPKKMPVLREVNNDVHVSADIEE